MEFIQARFAMTFSHDPAQLDRWNKRFSAEGYLFGKRPNAFLESQAARLRPGMSALCVADGEGRNSVWLAQRGLHVTAFDFSPVGVAKARELAREAGVAVDHRESDIFRWDWSARQFDVLVVIFIQFLSPVQRAEIFARFRDALKPEGCSSCKAIVPSRSPSARAARRRPRTCTRKTCCASCCAIGTSCTSRATTTRWTKARAIGGCPR